MSVADEYGRFILTANDYDGHFLSVTTDSLTSETSFSQGGRG